MKKFLFLPFFALITTTFSGCSKENRALLLRNINYLKSSQISNETAFVTLDNCSFESLVNLEIPFVLYLTKSECSYCQNFTPIITEWAKNEAHLILKIDEQQALDLNKKYNNILSRNDGTDYEGILYPSVGIVNSISSIDFIDNRKYMQTKHAFINHMNKTYRNSKIYYDFINIKNDEINKDYTYISFPENDEITKNLYKSKLLSKINDSEKNIVISNNTSKNELQISSFSLNKESDLLSINNSIESDNLNKYF